ncbi:HNH endonuclease [Argonema antarcticum]|uniref:HNH endonuclease n=1 Tax=Argonema antarcticum TaxID=2942763 RepID=UPI002012240E|nr:HNH endonuclease [Argonema antarcticum]MCL1472568.1 HNH endonuclease [Argonema antarcticum A004/B2]
MTINELTRQLVRKRAGYLCEYCHSPEKISTSRFTIDHIQPRSLNGSGSSILRSDHHRDWRSHS